MSDKQTAVYSEVPIGTLVADNYFEYGKYVNWFRAIPAIDGLKPVYRRILLAANDVASDKLVKTAKLSGEVIGNWHPHGSASTEPVISYLVRRGLLIGQGNHGADLLEYIQPAAPRYTEVKYDSKKFHDLLFKLVNYAPHSENEIGNQEPEYLITPVPILLIYGTFGIGLGVTTRIPALSYKSLLAAYKANDPTKLESTYGYRIVKADWNSLWTTGRGSMTLQYRITTEYSKEDDCRVTIIEGSGELFKPELSKLEAWMDMGRIFIRNESNADNIRLVIGRNKNIRIISDEDLYQLCLKSATTTKLYDIKVNIFGVIKRISIKDWLDVTMGLYSQSLDRWKADQISKFNTKINELKILPEVVKLLNNDKSNEDIAKILNVPISLVNGVTSRPLSILRKSNFDSEIDSLKKKIESIAVVTLDSILTSIKL
jgi:DNA gyrase/topoisomerase IV subunit A